MSIQTEDLREIANEIKQTLKNRNLESIEDLLEEHIENQQTHTEIQYSNEEVTVPFTVTGDGAYASLGPVIIKAKGKNAEYEVIRLVDYVFQNT